MNRPQTTAILAMSADGKITDVNYSAARFTSSVDKAHLEKQIALVDAVIFGAGTLRAYGTTLTVSNSELLKERNKQKLSPQPINIVCSASANINPELRFFSQKIPRWLLTTNSGALKWHTNAPQQVSQFEKILIASKSPEEIDWIKAYDLLTELGIKKLAILGGGFLVASLLELDLIDEFWLTICPVILGGAKAPTPVDGAGFLSKDAKHLQLLSVEKIEQEIFLHYRLIR